ncbi:MAG: hypothetical protein KF726_16160, partial [Anaerolineae bacterium]|nr:hypothetical protein [Anaerolineae bacterium]
MKIGAITIILTVILSTTLTAIRAANYSDPNSSACLVLDGYGTTTLLDINSGMPFTRANDIYRQMQFNDPTQVVIGEQFILTRRGDGYRSALDVKITSLATGKEIFHMAGEQPIGYHFSSDNHFLVYYIVSYPELYGEPRLFLNFVTLNDGEPVALANLDIPYSYDTAITFRWLSDFRGFVVVEDDQFKIWTIAEQKWRTIKLPYAYDATAITVSISPDEAKVLINYQSRGEVARRSAMIYVSDTSLSTESLFYWDTRGVPIWSPDSTRLAMLYDETDYVNHLTLFDVSATKSKILSVIRKNKSPTRLLKWSANSTRLYYADADTAGDFVTVKQLDISTPNDPIPVIEDIPVEFNDDLPLLPLTALLSLDGYDKLVAVISDKGNYNLVILDTVTGTLETALAGKTALSFPQWNTSNGTLLVKWSDNTDVGIFTINAKSGVSNNLLLSQTSNKAKALDFVESKNTWWLSASTRRLLLLLESPSAAAGSDQAAQQEVEFRILDLSSGALSPLQDGLKWRETSAFVTADAMSVWVYGVLDDGYASLVHYDTDGKVIARFNSPQPGKWLTYVISPDGNHVIVWFAHTAYLLVGTTNTAVNLGNFLPQNASWSADSQHVLFYDYYWVALYDTQGNLVHIYTTRGQSVRKDPW